MSPVNRFQMPLPERNGSAPSEPFERVIDAREVPCTVCDRPCRFESVTSPNPDAPEFLKTRSCWLGFVLDRQDESLSYVVACSEECVRHLLREAS